MDESNMEYSYGCPPGTYTATCYALKTLLTPRVEHISLVFEIDDFSTDDQPVLIGKKFLPDLTHKSSLRKFLDTWLGPKFVPAHSDGDQFNWRFLLGQKGLVTLAAITRRKPIVQLKDVRPVKSKVVRANPRRRPSPPSDSERFLEELANQIRSAPRYEPDRIYCPPLSPKHT